MKKVLVVSTLVAAPFLSAAALAQMTDGMNGMNMDHKSMGTMPMVTSHHATGTVKRLDASAGRVTIAHGPVPSVNWQAMTMTFTVKEKKILANLAEGKKIDFDFIQDNDTYVITSVR